jgi:hypothetical protein
MVPQRARAPSFWQTASSVLRAIIATTRPDLTRSP